MVACLATGDFHLHATGELSRAVDGNGDTALSNLILESADWMASILAEWRKSNDDFLYVGGDLTTTPGVLTATDLRLMSRTEQVFTLHGLDRVYNIGNHDLAGRQNGLHNLEMYRCIPQVTLAEPGCVLFCRGLHVVPFTFDLDAQRRLLASIPDGAVVAVHIPIIGTRMTPDITGESDTREEVGLDPTEFARFRLTLASHYHVPQIRYADGFVRVYDQPAIGKIASFGTILVLGTPLAHSFSDRNQVYGVFLLDVEEDCIRYRFVPNPYSPRYITASVENVEQLRGLLPEGPANVFLSIDASGEFADELRRMSAADLIGDGECVLLDKRVRKARPLPSRGGEQRLIIAGQHDMLDVVREYLTRYQEHNLDPERATSYLAPMLSALPIEERIGGNVRFLRLNLEDFMSWERATLDLSGSGLVLIQGTNHDAERADSNGSGKTALLESLVWCLYDSFLREVDSKDRAVRFGSRGCIVEVWFVTQEGTFLVRRVRAGGKGAVSLWRLSEGGVTWCDISATTALDINKQIVTTLGIPFSIFTSTTFFGSRFLNKFTELGDSGRKQYLGMAFGLNHYEVLRSRVKQDSDAVSAEYTRLISRETTMRESLDRSTRELEDSCEQAEHAGRIRDEALVASRHTLELKRQVLEQLQAMVSTAEHNVSSFRAEVAADLAQQESLQILLRTQIGNRDSWTRAVASKEGDLVVVLADLDEHMRDVGAQVTCPVCARPLDEIAATAVLLRHEQERQRLDSRVASAKQALADSKVAHTKAVDDVRTTEALLSDVKYSNGEEQKAKLSLLVDVAQSRSRGCAEAQRQVELFVSDVARLESEDPWRAVAPREYALEQETTRHAEVLDALTKAEATCAFVHGLFDILGPKAIISYLLDNILQEVNNYLAWLTPMIFGADCSVVLVPTRTKKTGGEENTITVQVNTLGGSYGSSSDGEQRKVDIAIHLALSSMLGRMGRGATNLLIGDQVFDGGSLDQTASRAVVETLKTFANDEGKRVIIISHSDTGIVPFVRDVIQIERIGGISRMVGQDEISRMVGQDEI